MACTRPLHGWLSKELTKNGKRALVFRRSEGIPDAPRSAPCGVCPGCRGSRSMQWSTRAYLELLSYPADSSCFVTLTYDDSHLPASGSLDPEHLRLYWMRVRKGLWPERIRYLACGEYGETTSRPHYHAIIFGYVPPDLVRYNSTLSTSMLLGSEWPYGSTMIGEATSASASYVAGYVTKKLSHDSYPAGLVPPFLRVSSKPALGSRWVKEHYLDLVHDRVYVGEGSVAPVPKHILLLLEKEAPSVWRAIRQRRQLAARASEMLSMDTDQAVVSRPGLPSAASVEKNIVARQRVRDYS